MSEAKFITKESLKFIFVTNFGTLDRFRERETLLRDFFPFEKRIRHFFIEDSSPINVFTHLYGKVTETIKYLDYHW